ncbi:MAG: hypothetical protein AB7S26_13910 [Sandaracinaceae bacterium]
MQGRPGPLALAPPSAEARREAIDELGRRVWAAMANGEPQRLLIDEVDLRELLDASAATRVTVRRTQMEDRLGPTDDFAGLMASAEYAGICVQGARDVEPGGPLGLRSPGWVADRVLVIGRRPSGQRIASWLEGLWLYCEHGFRAAELERVERPRWEHSDLEIAPCDLSIRNDLPDRAR